MEYDEGQIRNKVKVSLIRNKKKESSSKKKMQMQVKAI